MGGQRISRLFAKIKRITDGKREDGSIAASNPSRAGNFELKADWEREVGFASSERRSLGRVTRDP